MEFIVSVMGSKLEDFKQGRYMIWPFFIEVTLTAMLRKEFRESV